MKLCPVLRRSLPLGATSRVWRLWKVDSPEGTRALAHERSHRTAKLSLFCAANAADPQSPFLTAGNRKLPTVGFQQPNLWITIRSRSYGRYGT